MPTEQVIVKRNRRRRAEVPRPLRGNPHINVGDSQSHDGFRLHRNPDGSWFFLEGRSKFRSLALTGAELRSLDACARRRGIIETKNSARSVPSSYAFSK